MKNIRGKKYFEIHTRRVQLGFWIERLIYVKEGGYKNIGRDTRTHSQQQQQQKKLCFYILSLIFIIVIYLPIMCCVFYFFFFEKSLYPVFMFFVMLFILITIFFLCRFSFIQLIYAFGWLCIRQMFLKIFFRKKHIPIYNFKSEQLERSQNVNEKRRRIWKKK